MPDIAMCDGADCPFRDECRRYTAEPSERQSYMGAPWYLMGGKMYCDFFMDSLPSELSQFSKRETLADGVSRAEQDAPPVSHRESAADSQR